MSDASVASGTYEELRLDGNRYEAAGDFDGAVPREVVREVAASLKSLSRILPYPEYAAIVHRIARLRWRITTG